MSEETKHILVIDDDKRLRELLSQYLEGEGFVISTAQDAEIARTSLSHMTFDLLIMDVMMPGESGLELTRSLKKHFSAPILMLTALGEAEDRIKGLESGADDYLVKPFEPRELCLRIENLVDRKQQRTQPTPAEIVKFGDYVFNTENSELRRKNGDNNDFISLTSTELALLTIFAFNLNDPVSREELARRLNGISERSVDVQVTRLRKRIESNPRKPVYLQTARGKGYVLRG